MSIMVESENSQSALCPACGHDNIPGSDACEECGQNLAQAHGEGVEADASIFQLPLSRLRRNLALKVVIQFNRIEASVFCQLETLAKTHQLWVGKRPKINRLCHVIPFQRTLLHVYLNFLLVFARLFDRSADTRNKGEVCFHIPVTIRGRQ